MKSVDTQNAFGSRDIGIKHLLYSFIETLVYGYTIGPRRGFIISGA